MGSSKVTVTVGKRSVTAKKEKVGTRAQRAQRGEVGMAVRATQNPKAGVIASRGRIPVLRDANGNIDFNAMRERTTMIQNKEKQPKKKTKKK